MIRRLAATVVVISLVLLVGSHRSWADERLPVAPPVSRGDSGLQVVQVQQILASAGYTVVVDGQYGPQTERAVRHWQRVNGLSPDGVVGPRTLASLISWGDRVSARDAARQTGPTPPARAATSTPEQIIRDVWPDDLEEHALAIAHRESRFVPSARNACCYGLFQINYGAHRGWLAGIGVTSAAMLLDPTTNATAALALYRRDGWGPWAL